MLTFIRAFFWRLLGNRRRAGAIVAARSRKLNKAAAITAIPVPSNEP